MFLIVFVLLLLLIDTQSLLNNDHAILRKTVGVIAGGLLSFNTIVPNTIADDTAIKSIPVYTQRDSQLQGFSDIGRGFKMLRPFGFNEFDGAGGGYVVKFASLFDVDENVVIGSAPASAGKTSILDYGNTKPTQEQVSDKQKFVNMIEDVEDVKAKVKTLSKSK